MEVKDTKMQLLMARLGSRTLSILKYLRCLATNREIRTHTLLQHTKLKRLPGTRRSTNTSLISTIISKLSHLSPIQMVITTWVVDRLQSIQARDTTINNLIRIRATTVPIADPLDSLMEADNKTLNPQTKVVLIIIMPRSEEQAYRDQ
jgi:hypothetical protein